MSDVTVQQTPTSPAKPKKERKSRAEHRYLDVNGDLIPEDDDDVEPVQEAHGYRYILKETGDTFDWELKDATQDEIRKLAIFGAKTLSTNETSAARQKHGDTGTGALQMEALRTRFQDLRDGTWIDRTREGAVTDKEKLATAIVEYKIELGKVPAADKDAAWTETRKRLEEDAKYLKGSRALPEVASRYAALMGRTPTMTVDDL